MAVANPTTVSHRLPAIENAVERTIGTELHNSFEDTTQEIGDWIEYTTQTDQEGEIECTDHFIEFVDCPSEMHQTVYACVHQELIKNGYMLNSVDFENKRAHVMHTNWFTRRDV